MQSKSTRKAKKTTKGRNYYKVNNDKQEEFQARAFSRNGRATKMTSVLRVALLVVIVSADEKHRASDRILVIDGHLINVGRSDSVHFRFNPDNDTSENNDTDYKYNASQAYESPLRKLIRRSDDDDDDKGGVRRVTCVETLEKFRALAKNKPLQFVVVVEEGAEARLTCHYCEDNVDMFEGSNWDTGPRQKNLAVFGTPILWYRIQHFGGDAKAFRLNEVRPSLSDDDDLNRIYVTSGHTLVVSKSQPEDAGTYFCRDTRKSDKDFKTIMWDWELKNMMGDKGAFRFLIHLDVLSISTTPVKEVSTDGKGGLPKMSPDKNVEHRNMKVFTEWGRWGPCSVCDAPGEQRRIGVCTVKKLRPNDGAKPWFVNAVLNAQATGVPCRSTLFHVGWPSMNYVANFLFRPDEVLRKSCNKPCRKLSFRKTSGKSLSPAGLKAVFKEEKLKKEAAKIKIINETAGASLKLKCPGATLDAVVMWMNNSRYIPGVSMANATGGRVSVDINGTLHISPLTVWDRRLFVCIVSGKETGRVFLNVTVIVENEFAKYGAWVVYSIAVDFVAFVALMVVKHRHRKRILISAEEAARAIPPEGGSSSSDENNSNLSANANIWSISTTDDSATWSGDDVSSSPSLSTSVRTGSCRSSRYGSYGLPSQTSI